MTLAASVLVCGSVLAAASVERREILLDFGTKEGCERAKAYLNPWGGDKCGRARFDAAEGALRIVSTNTLGTFSSMSLPGLLTQACRGDEAPWRYFVVYRVVSQNGGASMHFVAGDTYVTRLGLRRDGARHEVSLRPGGWSRRGQPIDPAAVRDIHIAISGTNDVFLYRLGAIYRPKAVAHVDPVPLDTEAVAVFPEPRHFHLGQGQLRLSDFSPPVSSGFGTAYAAEWFAREMRTFYGEGAFAAKGGKPITFALLPVHGGTLLPPDADRIVHDGFAIRVAPDGISVVGREPMGVMNGVRTLATLVKQISGDVGPARLRELSVVDWPRIGNRLFHQMMSCYDHANRYAPSEYADFLERFLLDARFNLFCFEPGEHYRYESVPGTGTRRQSWCRKDLGLVVDRLNAAGAKVVPYVQSPGHQAIGLFCDKGVRPDLYEEGNRDVLCTRHPDAYRFLFGVFGEMADVCAKNPGYRSGFFHAGGDEVRWKTDLPPDRRCPRCRDIPHNRRLLDHVVRVNDWCRAHGYRMLLASDMYVDNHNGSDAFRCAEIRDSLPRDIVFNHWAGMDFEAMGDLAKQGFGNWKVMTGFQDDPEGDEFAEGYGLSLYTYNWWLSETRAADHANYGLMAQHLIGEQAWCGGSARLGAGRDRVSHWGNFLMRNWSRKPIPHGTDDFVPVSLSAAANVPLEGALDWSVRELARVPVVFARNGAGAPAGVAAATNAVMVGVGRKAASLVFLHTAELPAVERKPFFLRANYRDETEGPVIATWTVGYADGTSAKFEVKYGWNVGGRRPGDRHSMARFVADARFAWTAEDGETAYLHEWVNPHPEKEIVSLALGAAHPRMRYTLLALSARKVDRRTEFSYN